MNLTREEAATRSATVAATSYEVALDLTVGESHFLSSTTVRFSALQGASTFVDLVDAQDLQISFNGAELDPRDVYVDSRIELTGLAESNELIVTARLPYSRTGEGLHRFVDPADDRVYLYSQFEVPDARRVYAAFEQPDLKSIFTFTVTAPDHWLVVSNSPTPKPVPAGEGKATWNFPPTERMSTYITAIIAGEYYATFDSYAGAGGEIELGHYCRQSIKQYLDIEELLEVTKQGFEFFEKTFQRPYPFGKYDQLYVPEYNMGAMENAGAVTFRDEYLPRSRQVYSFYEQRANTILHEMAHMWFGNLVTMRWWDDLWLNESFAEWASHYAMEKATKYSSVWTGFTNARKNWAYRQDQLPSTHPIAADNYDLEAVEVNFDGITYAKGASTLKQLVAWVGEDEFIAGLRQYFTDHAWGNTEFTDLTRALEASSGRDLDSWAEEWLKTSGVNTLAPEFDVAGGVYSNFTVAQSAHPDYPTLRRHRIGIGLYDFDGDRLSLRDRIDVDVVGGRTPIPELDGVTQPDLLLLNDGDLTYAKIRLDERSLATAIEHIDAIDDSLARALVWGAAWDMTRDAQLSPQDFTDLVLRGIGSESDSTAVARLPMYVRTAVEYYSAPGNRDELRTRWETGVFELLTSAEPGSDHQLSFARLSRRPRTRPRSWSSSASYSPRTNRRWLASPASPSMRTCAGPSSLRSPARGSSASKISQPNWPPMPPSPGKNEPPSPALFSRPRRPRKQRGAMRSSGMTSRMRLSGRPRQPSPRRARRRCSSRTSRSTFRPPRRSGRPRGFSEPPRRWSSCSRCHWSPANRSTGSMIGWRTLRPTRPRSVTCGKVPTTWPVPFERRSAPVRSLSGCSGWEAPCPSSSTACITHGIRCVGHC